jgi:hypothetical protein
MTYWAHNSSKVKPGNGGTENIHLSVPGIESESSTSHPVTDHTALSWVAEHKLHPPSFITSFISVDVGEWFACMWQSLAYTRDGL